ncbi:MAG TPA: alpha-L-rhamnosidase C-terminal domain-containing protein [Armatimonadota bacterium]|nr:alpha-L-rhamnosidase C-terminal domain-containing protein [Armatimonadota bacterium]
MKFLPSGTGDPRVRRYVLPTRVVWSSGGAVAPEHLLTDDEHHCTLVPAKAGETTSILLDYGQELHGGIRIECPTIDPKQSARIRVRFGESVGEAMGTPDQDHTIHNQETLVPWMGHTEIGNTGFRFVRIDLLEPTAKVTLANVKAVFLYRPLEYRGSFESSDERLNRIWDVGAYTVHLCMQDHVWDGIKRDRLVWIGDLHPELMVINTVFGKVDIVPASLDYVRDRTPLPGWMNGIGSYSLWWILCHRDWYRYHGDLEYVREQRKYLLGLLELVRNSVGPDGKEQLAGHRFLEWPTSRDPTAIDAGLQSLVVLSLRAGAELCDLLGEKAAAEQSRAVAARAAAHRRAPSPSKQANALSVLAGMADAGATNAQILARNPHSGLSTFYGYYILQARAQAGDYEGCLELIRRYWGGMLDRGATTFWEGFELEWLPGSGRIDELPSAGTKDLHADYGDYCYVGLRHSLCHGWAAGPTAWLTEHVLGLTPATAGFGKITLRPHLGNLEYASGTLPTPHGVLKVRHEKRRDGKVETKIDAPRELRERIRKADSA